MFWPCQSGTLFISTSNSPLSGNIQRSPHGFVNQKLLDQIYVIALLNRRKPNQVCHLNLKPYYACTSNSSPTGDVKEVHAICASGSAMAEVSPTSLELRAQGKPCKV